MSFGDRVRKMLAEAARPAECMAARCAWVKETMAAWRRAQRQMDERCTEAVMRLSEQEFERLFEKEQAKVDTFRVPVEDAAERDVWPRHLYRGRI